MCQFENDDNNTKVFKDHYKNKHPSVAVKYLTVFEKVSVFLINKIILCQTQIKMFKIIVLEAMVLSIKASVEKKPIFIC